MKEKLIMFAIGAAWTEGVGIATQTRLKVTGRALNLVLTALTFTYQASILINTQQNLNTGLTLAGTLRGCFRSFWRLLNH